jgi:dihydropyrimidinase
MFDLVLEGGHVANPGGPVPLDVAVLGGKIAAIGLPGTLGARADTMQLDGLLLVPGGVEPHVHAGHPLVSPRDGSAFFGGGPMELSRAAIYGGTTTLIDFARIPPGGPIWPVVEEQKAVWSGQSFCDHSFHVWFHGDVTDDQLAEVPDVVAKGFPSFKVFTTDGLPSRRGRKVNMGSLLELMGKVAEHGGVIAVHGEDDDLVMHTYEKLVREGNTDRWRN